MSNAENLRRANSGPFSSLWVANQRSDMKRVITLVAP